MASYDSGAGGLVALRTPAMDFDPTRTATKAATGQARPLQPAISIVFHPSRRFEGSSRVPGRGETILLGRESEDLVPGALDDSRISRRHATIQRHGASLELEDLGSHNGTRVNGHTVTRAVLNPGDVVAVGPLLLLVQQLDPQTRVPGHPRILGRSAALGRLLALIERVASTEVTVLVLGEPGVGKELIAEEIHRQSGRSGALVTLNCAGVADGVIQSELFGHTRGAFSGAERARRGLVNEAIGGTLFLDEIGDASLNFQANLLRLLQQREVRAVGSDRRQRVDVRFVAATNRSLMDAVEEGSFRADLWGRLEGCVLTVPPLRERPEDIVLLARHFLDHAAPGHPRLGPELAADLLRYRWPGNVRELESVIERLCIESEDPEPSTPDWFTERLDSQSSHPAATLGLKPRTKVSKEQLQALLDRHGGNVSAAAEELDVARNTVYRWLKKHGIRLDTVRPD